MNSQHCRYFKAYQLAKSTTVKCWTV